MKPISWRLICLVASALLLSLLAVLISTAPKHPVALVRVVDVAGRPLAGAVILPEGLRTKPGPYVSGWYGWRSGANGVTNAPVTTDQDGYASVPYPKFVFERIETGTLCLSVNHPEFVPARPECVVATAPPAGAPWRVRLEDLWNRVRHKTLIAHSDPVVLGKGAILKISVPPAASISTNAHLFALASGNTSSDTNFWIHPAPGVIVTRRLAPGPHTVRAVALDLEGSAWFSEVTSFMAATGETNELVLPVKRGLMVRGQLDGSVPRPVKNGRVVAHVSPADLKLEDNPPQWHAWAAIKEDGTFAMGPLPDGGLEILALCDGYVSTNGPGQFHMRYPQKHLLATNDLAITIGMEPTARLEVDVTDDQGRPLRDVRVATWPNARYGEWSAVILMGDCYNTSDWLQSKPGQDILWGKPVPDFQGVSDSAGRAVLPNLPADVNELAVEHPQFDLPPVGTAASGMRRQASIALIAGQTNRMSIQLEPRERSKISHY